MNSRNTIQKQVILNSIKNTKSHPTAYELYQMIKEENPTIGQATIYRNLKTMEQDGDITIIPSKNNINRYDGDLSNHDHFICEKCGKVIDIYTPKNIVEKEIEKQYGVKIKKDNTTYEGICKDCIKINN